MESKSTTQIPNISGNLDRYESMCLDLIAEACNEVRSHLASKPDLNGKTDENSFAYVAGGWVRDKVGRFSTRY